MTTEFEIDRAEYIAFNEAILRSTVGIAVRNNTGIGTGTLVSFGNRRFVLTAAHVIEGVSLSEIKYFLPPSTSLKELPMRNVRRPVQESYAGESFIIDENAVIDDTNDLAAIPLASAQPMPSHVHFIRIEECLDTIRDGASVLIVGFPIANSALLDHTSALTRALGITSEHAIYSDALQNGFILPSSYNPDIHFLIEYSRMVDGISPFGFSGAAAWCSLSPRSSIWAAVPAFVGVVTRWHRATNQNPHMLQITRGSFVKEWFNQQGS